MPERTTRPRRTKVGDAKDPENNGNYNETTMERQGRRFKAYEANTTRVIRHSALIGRRRSIESRPDTVDGGSDIRSGSEMATRTQQRGVVEWEAIRRLLEKAVFEIVLSVLILLTATTGTVRKLVGVISWVEGQLPLLCPAQEEVEDERSSKKERSRRPLMESFERYRETVEDEANSDANSQRSNEESGRPVLSSFPAHPLERDALEVPVVGERNSTGTSFEAEAATLLETESLTPQGAGTDTPSVKTSQSIVDMSTFRFPMPVPGSEGMPYFSGANITEFLERFDELCDEYQVVDRKAKLPRYCDSARREVVKSLPEWESGAKWEELVEALKEEFRSSDRYQSTYSMTFLNEYIRMPRTNEGLKEYCRQYTSVSKVLVARKVLSEVDRGRLFLMGLPKQTRERLVAKLKVDDMKPETYSRYNDFLLAAREIAKSSLTSQALALQREPTPAYKQEIRELVEERGEIQKIPEELKKVPPVVPVGRPSVDRAQMDEMVREMARLRIQNLELDKRMSDMNRVEQYGAGQFGLPMNSMRPDQRQGYGYQDARGTVPTVQVNALRANGRMNCFYCFQKHDPAPHERKTCPWFLSDITKGVIHLDHYGMICLGPPRQGAYPISFQKGRAQGEQVRLMTAGTEYDANIDQRADNPSIYSHPPQEQSTSFGGQRQQSYPVQNEPSRQQGSHTASNPPTRILQNPARQQSSLGQAQEGPIGTNVNVGSICVVTNPMGSVSQEDQSGNLVVNAAAINKKGKGKTVSFENPSKVIKQRLRKEKRYAGLDHSLRQASLESGTVEDIGSDEDPHGPTQDEQADDEMNDVEPPLSSRPKPIRRARYIDKYTTPAKKQEAFDTLMKQKIVLEIQDLVAFEGGLTRLLGQRLPIVPVTGGSDVQVETLSRPEVSRMSVQQLWDSYDSKTNGTRADRVRIARRYPSSLAMQTGKMEARLGGKVTVAMTIDTGAEVNVLPRSVAERAKLTIQTDWTIVFKTLAGGQFAFFGLCREVEVDIGGIVNYVDFFVVNGGSDEVLLGMPFTYETQLTYEYPEDGSVAAVFKNSDRSKRGRVTVAGDDVDLGEVADSENE
jgi:hypothetical protein